MILLPDLLVHVAPNIATAKTVRRFLIPETVDSIPFLPDALTPTPDALAITEH
jgi:hypothetical protein